MKKHLIAAAVAAAVAVPAAAQVTVYGMISYEAQKTDTEASRKDTTINTSSSLGSPVIGFKGAEDLGGGLKAEFQLESGLDQGSGATSLFSRQNWVGVSGGFGSIRAGFQNNALKDIDGFGETGANLFDLDTALTLQNRDRRTLKYTSPSMNGFSFAVSNSQDIGSSVGGLEVTAYNVQYGSGPLKLAAGQASSKKADGFETEQTVFGGSYALGFATVDFSFQGNELTATEEADTVQIGAHIPVGKAFAVKLNYTDLDYTTAGSDVSYTGIMGVYSLSKRSSVFAGYRAESGNDGADVDVALIGINHSF